MSTTKRQRQKAARRAKMEELQRTRKRRKNLQRGAIIAVVAIVVIVTGALLFSGKSTTPTTTTTTASASATTTTIATTSTTTASTTTTSTNTTTTVASTSTASPVAGFATIPDPSPSGKFGVAPTVVVPTTAAPAALEASDLIKGTGASAVNGETLKVQYVLATYSTHKVVQSSWTSSPFSFELGANTVIQGWEKGIVGMRVGGRRELIIPPSLGYGDQSPGSGIAKNDTLVFVVDLLSIKK